MIQSSILTFIVIATGFFFCLFDAHCDQTIDEQKEQMKERDKKILVLEKKSRNTVEDRSNFIEEFNKQEELLRVLDRQIYDHSQEINHMKQRLIPLEERFEKRKKELARRMRIIYLQRDTHSLTQTKSAADLLAHLKHIYQAMQQDRRMIKRMKEERMGLQVVKHTLSVKLIEWEREKEQSKQLLEVLRYQIEKNRQTQLLLGSQVEKLESENEAAKSVAFQVVKTAIEKARAQEQESQLNSVYLGSDTFYWPVEGGVVTSNFGYRRDPIHEVSRLHRGVDIGAPLGTPIRSTMAGKVIESRPSNGYGYIVVLYHGNGVSTLYAHMYGSMVPVHVGDVVQKGQVIAHVGSNGWSTGPHLHFEVVESGQPRNPLAYFERTARG